MRTMTHNEYADFKLLAGGLTLEIPSGKNSTLIRPFQQNGPLTKTGVGTLTMAGSDSENVMTVKGGSVNLHAGLHEIISAGGKGVGNCVPAVAPIVLDGGNLGLIGRANAGAIAPRTFTYNATGVNTNHKILRGGNTSGLVVGMGITGANIPPGAFITHILDGANLRMSVNATGGTTGTTALSFHAVDNNITLQTFSNIEVRQSAVLTVDNNNGSGTTLTITGLTGGGDLAKEGSGTLVLADAKTFSGAIAVNQGALKLSPLPVNFMVNAGFELPAYGANGWSYLTSDGVTSGWSFSDGQAGVAHNGSPWLVPALAPEGVQVGFLQNLSHMKQSVTLPTTEAYRLLFSATRRPEKTAGDLTLLVDGVSKATWTAAQIDNGGVFKSYSVELGELTAGVHELKFAGTLVDALDRATLIDAVQIIRVSGIPPGPLPAEARIALAAGATLDLDGSSQSLAVLSGGGVVTNSAANPALLTITGTIAPGGANVIGTLTILGGSTLSGTLLSDVATDGSCDLLQVRGALDVSNLSLQIQEPGQLGNGFDYVVARCAPGGLSGRFLSHNLGNLKSIHYDNAAGEVRLIGGGSVMLIR